MIRMLGVLGVGGGLAILLAGACSSEETESNQPTPTTSSTTSTTTTTSTSGGGGSTTTTTSVGGSGGSVLLTCDVDYTNIEGECDLLAQDCPDGQVCRISGQSASCGAPQPGLKSVGATCGATTECSGALNCIADHCTPVCCGSTNEPCAGGRCDIHVNYGNDMWAMGCSYSLSCEVFAHTCPDGEDCHISDFQTGLAVCDEPSDTIVGEGEPCFYRNDCGDAQVCNRNAPDADPDAGVTGRCRYLCSVEGADNPPVGDGGCPAEQTCHSLNIGGVPDLGKCW